MKLRQLLVSLAAALATAGAAQAATFEGATGAAHVTSYSDASNLWFDIDFTSAGAVTLNFTVEAADLSGGLNFNSLVRNLSGLGFDQLVFSLSGATFSTPGTLATDGFQAITSQGWNAQQLWATFSPALTTEFHVGAPLGTGTDWTLSLAGAQVGDTFAITAAVPEPGAIAMLLAGFGVMGAMARRRRNAA